MARIVCHFADTGGWAVASSTEIFVVQDLDFSSQLEAWAGLFRLAL